jgi:hypothetical protein
MGKVARCLTSAWLGRCPTGWRGSFSKDAGHGVDVVYEMGERGSEGGPLSSSTRHDKRLQRVSACSCIEVVLTVDPQATASPSTRSIPDSTHPETNPGVMTE